MSKRAAIDVSVSRSFTAYGIVGTGVIEPNVVEKLISWSPSMRIFNYSPLEDSRSMLSKRPSTFERNESKSTNGADKP